VFVGLAHYVQLFHDPVFWTTIWHTAVFFVATFAAQVVLGMLFAVLLHSKVRLAVLYKIVVFVPVVLAPATMAPVFREIYAPNGQVNQLLHLVGLGFVAHPWLAQPGTALVGIISFAIWQSTGVAFILYFAAMSQIDTEVLEAARIDGVGNVRIISSIIWPSVRGTTVALAILSAIGALKTFDIPYLVTAGGPAYATEFLGTFIYRVSVPQSDVGYGAALSIMLLVLAVGMAITLSVSGRERVGTTNA
jgi:ABC-type sugar transport system permease subunit